MKLTVLGMNGPYPAAKGACSGYLLESGDTRVLMDLGTGVLANLTALMPPEELTAILLTHWHFDHCGDILPLIYRMEGQVAAGHAPLTVIAPEDETSPIRQLVKNSRCFRLVDVKPGDQLPVEELLVKVGEARHPVPAVMYRLSAGGHDLTYTGDTNTLPGIPAFIRGTELLLADGLFTRALWAEGKPHLSAVLCGELARDAGAGRLVITHLNPAIDPEALLREAREAFPGAELSSVGASWTL